MPTNQQRREAVKRKLERQQERRAENARKRRRRTVVTAIVTVVVVVAGVVLLTTLTSRNTTEVAEPETPAGVTPANIPTEIAAPPTRPNAFPAAVTCAYPAGQPPAKAAQPPPTANVPAQGTVGVTLNTSAGQVGLVLDRSLAPCTVNSFASLAAQGYFDGTSCHRLTTSAGLQVLQCGDPSGQGTGGPGYTFADETFPELTYGRGYLAMANSGPSTNGSQFFMIYGDAELPPDYTVFGAITPEGLAVVDEIARTGHDGSLDPSPGGGKPVTEVRIEKAAKAG